MVDYIVEVRIFSNCFSQNICLSQNHFSQKMFQPRVSVLSKWLTKTFPQKSWVLSYKRFRKKIGRCHKFCGIKLKLEPEKKHGTHDISSDESRTWEASGTTAIAFWLTPSLTILETICSNTLALKLDKGRPSLLRSKTRRKRSWKWRHMNWTDIQYEKDTEPNQTKRRRLKQSTSTTTKAFPESKVKLSSQSFVDPGGFKSVQILSSQMI